MPDTKQCLQVTIPGLSTATNVSVNSGIMIKSIHTLVPDIYTLLKGKKGWFTDELAQEFSHSMGQKLKGHLGEDKAPRGLRLSGLGSRCPKALWHSIHTPQLAEALPPWAEIKYSYGHIIEALAITLAKAAGHTVTGEQDEVNVDGITGHRDCVIDGCVVDVKSASSRGFIKFKDKSISMDDGFGYLEQLDGYCLGSARDDLVQVKDKAYILAIDKQLGHMCLYEHRIREDHIKERIRTYKEIVARSEPPECRCGVLPDGKSGNVRLDTRASYSAFKHCCFPLLRTFLYASGPVFLTKVVREPDVVEVDREGRMVYN